MTAQTRTVNKAAFEQGDNPQGTDYADLIDSFLAIADTTTQTINSNLIAPNITVTGEVSASDVNTSVATIKSVVFASATTTVLSTAQTSAIYEQSGQGAHKVFGLINVQINSTTVSIPFMHRGTYV